jgi:hypothetical protein
MGEVRKHGQAVGDDLVALATLDVGDEADSARVMIKGAVIQPFIPRLLGAAGFHYPPSLSGGSTDSHRHDETEDYGRDGYWEESGNLG